MREKRKREERSGEDADDGKEEADGKPENN